MQHVEKHAEDFERRVEILTDIGLVTVNANPADVCARGGKNTNDLGIIYILYIMEKSSLQITSQQGVRLQHHPKIQVYPI